MTRITFLLLALLVTGGSCAQSARLHLDIDMNDQEECAELTIYNDQGAVYSHRLHDYFCEEIDSLPAGTYRLAVTECSNPGVTLLGREFVLSADSVTHLDLSCYASVDRTAVNDTIRTLRFVTQIMIGYTNNKWAYEDPALTSSSSIGFGQSTWHAFSRNVGLLTGGGMTLTHSSIAKDTSFMDQSPLAKRYEYYNYLDLRCDIAIRLSSKNQQTADFTGFTVDIGASYHFPLLFKHVARYGGNRKFMNGGLHQFTDCRLFVNIGYAPCLLFAEYRLFDFILGSYPELPTWNFGLKIDIPQLFYPRSSYNGG